jgi:hypothetical protein
LCIYTGSQVAVALSDPSVRIDIFYGHLPKGTTIVPFNNPQNYYSAIPRLEPTEPISPLNWLGLLSPLISFTATVAAGSIRYYRWKRSIHE